MADNFVIKNIGGHIEVYDAGGSFILSADNISEAEEDIELLFA